MSVAVRCPRCGCEHPSRIRARDAATFEAVNPQLGSVLETCPRCHAMLPRNATDRAWKDDSRALWHLSQAAKLSEFRIVL